MTYIIIQVQSGSYVRPCPPERGLEHTINLGEALRFATPEAAAAYLAARPTTITGHVVKALGEL